MTIEGVGAAPEPNKEPTTNATPSPAKRNMSKSKRLLPMELRKRRRAAKLQISAKKKRRVELGEEPSPPTPQKPTSKPTEEVGVDAQQKRDSHEDDEVERETTVVSSPASATKKTLAKRSSPLAAAAMPTTLNRLQSLYEPSLLNQQRKRRPAGANVPNTFHVSDLPLDIVPKTKLSILTAFPYPFQRSNSRIKKQALQHFVTGGDKSVHQSASQSTAVRWHEALHYFVHSAASVPTSILLNRATAANTSEPLLGGPKGERKREEKAFFTARWNTWQEAFRDLYMNFRRQSTGASNDGLFYLRSSDFVICFLYDPGAARKNDVSSSIINLCRQHDNETESYDEMEGEAKSTESVKKCKLYAVMSESNARIRKVLHHLNVKYSMPYVNANQTQREAGEFHLLQEEEANRSRNKNASGGGLIAPVTRAVPSQENMHGSDSLLLFHGHDDVHGLYEFLINRAPMSNQDVPELYALHPFANATIQSLQVTSYGRVSGLGTVPLSEDQSSRTASLFRTEVLGFCFPSCVEKLLGVLKDECEAMKTSQFAEETAAKDSEVVLRAYMEAVSGAERLNAVRLDEQTTVDPGEKRRQKHQEELEISKRRVEAVVVTRLESRYVVETTTRPIVVRR
ncbi:hypothetical protein PF008_g8546 [Phytophthora fragariae]|uniref:Uncharacterized protein n=1 Tax=Phytophthora fragariae TaxID=53985 RepID=A0A6G0RZE4_9STRA|nr:hypothetical protein PF008_g8546 [Phytophthora fragariae]